MKKIIVVLAVSWGFFFGGGFELSTTPQEAHAKKWYKRRHKYKKKKYKYKKKKKVKTIHGCKSRFAHKKKKKRRCKSCIRSGGKFKKQKGGPWYCKR